ncbi:hypothetical protein CASFOL_028212 [Castilleja foliolosa]|uniref:Uncharacterized protein n=1 Tax=Castilleja foliolosa TaxID=1961234 RepID=A0ABD3CGI2_9LAMI
MNEDLEEIKRFPQYFSFSLERKIKPQQAFGGARVFDAIVGNAEGQKASSKSQAAIFLVLAIVLRHKQDVLISILPKLRENSKYQEQDKLPLYLRIKYYLLSEAFDFLKSILSFGNGGCRFNTCIYEGR